MRYAESSFQPLVAHILAFHVKNVNLKESVDFAILEITKWQVSGGLRKRNIPHLFDCWTCYRILFWHIDDLAILKLVGRTYAFAFLAIA